MVSRQVGFETVAYYPSNDTRIVNVGSKITEILGLMENQSNMSNMMSGASSTTVH